MRYHYIGIWERYIRDFYRHAMEIDKIFRYNRIVNRNMSGNRILVISENKEVFTWLI